MACEKSREGGEEMENICSVYLLRTRMHDHNPLTVPQAFTASLNLYVPFPLISLFLSLSLFSYFSHCPPTFFVILQHG